MLYLIYRGNDMDFINGITGDTLIVSDSNIKELFFKAKLLKPIKFMTLKEFLSNYYFTYDESALIYLMDKYHIKYDIALEYLENLYYLEDKEYESGKLAFLVNLKKELSDNKLLIYNEYFNTYLKHTKIILYDVYLDNFLKKTLSNYDYQVIIPDEKHHHHQVSEFIDMEAEINYVAKRVAKLIDEGISPEKIKLTNITDDYYNSLNRIFGYYGLKVNIPYQTRLTSYPLVKTFTELYQVNDDISAILKEIKDGSVIYDELVKVINKYLKYNNKELLLYKIENSFITSNDYDQGIDIVDYLNYLVSDDEYLFMLGFNEGSSPKNILDTSYITDNICEVIGLNTSSDKNNYLKVKTLRNIGNIKNLVITYKLNDFKRSYYPSTLCSAFEVITPKDNPLESYSSLADRIKLVKCYDEYFKYGVKDHNFDLLMDNYHIAYDSYNHKYQKIDRVMDKLSLSYTTMNKYNKCAFKYYLSEILRLDIFAENFSMTIGGMVHYVLEKCLKNNDDDTDKYANEYLKEKTFSKKENFFLAIYRNKLKELLEQIQLEKTYYLFDKALYEQRITIDYGNNITFTGVIDKVLYMENNDTTYVALIDYKTGNDNITLEYLKYGIDIQLPIYLYLSTRLPFTKIKYCGFYLQKFNFKDDDYRLLGYSNSDIATLKIIDKQYDNSQIIKGLKTNQDGSFGRFSKVLSDKEIAGIIEVTKTNIDKVINGIKHNDFNINPKVSKGVNIGCEYCKFKDICFHDYTDEVMITGGEE